MDKNRQISQYLINITRIIDRIADTDMRRYIDA